MRQSILLAGCLLFIVPIAGQAQAPRLTEERLVMHTVAGDVVIALFPDVAPHHVQQILHLARLGVYDHTTFHRIEPGFVLQLADATVREDAYALTDAQKKAIHPIPAEFSATLKHRRGTVSMARADGQPDSATTSFSIVLGDAPHLDGQYTIVGQVLQGMDVVDKLVLVPPLFIDPRSAPLPLVPLDVSKLEVVTSKELDSIKLTPAHDVKIPPGAIAKAHKDAWVFHRQKTTDMEVAASASHVGTLYLQAGGLLLIALLSLAPFVAASRLGMRWLVSLNMLTLLVAAFLLLTILAPVARDQSAQYHSLLAVLLFLSFYGIFKLLGRFESVG